MWWPCPFGVSTKGSTMKKFPKFTDEQGASMAEYGLLLAGIAAVVGAAVFTLGTDVTGLYDAAVALFT